MKRSLKILALAAPFLLTSSISHAALFHFDAPLFGAAEAPPNASPGTGFANITLDTGLQQLHVQATFAGLIGNTTASHIHCCTAPGTNVPPATTVPSFVGFPLGVKSGTFDGLLDLTSLTAFNPVFVAGHGGTAASAAQALTDGLFAGQSYFNIHTSVFPAGEIRGFLTVPEPGTLSLLAFGLAAGGLWLRRRRS